MFKVFRKNKQNNKEDRLTTNPSTINANELFEEVSQRKSDEEVETDLSLHPTWKLDEEENYVLRFKNIENPPLKPNQLSLAGYELKKEENNIIVHAFVRNSLNKKISFRNTTLLLLREDGTKLARKIFNLSSLGEIPPSSSRPWVFIFESKDLLYPSSRVPVEGWNLVFEIKDSSKNHSLDLADSWQQSLADTDIKKLESLVENLKPPQPGAVNFMGVKAQHTNDGDLHITVLIRNGSDKDINLEQLPLQVEDAKGEIIAQGGFHLEGFQVKANTSKPWTFIFPKSIVKKNKVDLSEWKAIPIKK